MATHYVDSSASGSNDGTSWTNAWTSLGSSTGAAAGDVVLVASTHSEAALTTNTTWNWSNGTETNPVRIISANTSDDSYLRGATVWSVAGSAYDLTYQGNTINQGLDFVETTAGADLSFGFSDKRQVFIDCDFDVGGQFKFTSDENIVIFEGRGRTLECDYFFSASEHNRFVIKDHVLIINSSSYGFRTYGQSNSVLVEDCDLSGCTKTDLFSSVGGERQGRFEFRRCELKASWSTTALTVMNYERLAGQFVESSASGTVSAPVLGNTKIASYGGTIASDSARYRTDGATDGETAHCWDMTTDTNAKEEVNYITSPPITRWVDAGSQTITVYVASGVTLNDDDFWIEVSSPNETANPNQTAQGKFRTSKMDPLATPSALTTDSGSTWNGSGVGTKQKIDVSITPTEPGPVVVRCCLSKASTSVYVDPKIGVA